MKKVLLTGGSGFVGKNILPRLSEAFEIVAPTRGELNLLSEESVRGYLEKEGVDLVFHCANPTPAKNKLDSPSQLVEDSIRVFLNLKNSSEYYDRMIYIGSGAEYDKSRDISDISETAYDRTIPKDAYGFAKYAINQIAQASEKVTNMCLFACYGPWDHESKFITHCIRCCMDNEPITIRQDCLFDYIHVYDLAEMFIWIGNNEPNYKRYNISGNEHMLLSEIAREVKEQMNSPSEIEIIKEGLNNEYTADGSRFWNESGLRPLISMREGISMQIDWERKNRK